MNNARGSNRLASWRTGLNAFRLVAFGQIISGLGNELSAFASTIWAFEKTGSVTALGLILFFHFIPYLIALPFVGAIVDRTDRRLMMLVSDLISVAVTAIFTALSLANALEIWHLYVGFVIIGVGSAFQEPAFVSAMGAMLKSDEIPKASGALGLVDPVRSLIAPTLAAVLYPVIGLGGVFVVDLLTFLPALATLLLIRIPPHNATDTKREVRWLEDASFGFRYIFARPHMLMLLLCSSFFNVAWGITQAVQPAFILARGDEAALAAIRTAMGLGALIGGLAVTTWGAPKPRIGGVIISIAVLGSSFVLTGVGAGVVVWVVVTVIGMLVWPLLGASTLGIWQPRIDPAIQGRVFVARRFLVTVATPIGTLLAGPLTDGWLTGAMSPGGALSDTFGWLVGVNSSAGFALALVFAGVFQLGIAAAALLNPRVRNVERIEPLFVPPTSASSQ